MSVAKLKPFEGVIASGPRAEFLACIAHPAVTLAIWRRQLTDELKGVAELISEDDIGCVTLINPHRHIDSKRFTQELNSSTGRDCTALLDDLLDLSRWFADASQNQTVRIRFETVNDNGCRRFHLDNVSMRLVITYSGPGTQWVPTAFADAAREQQENYVGPLNCLGTGDAAIFRGKKSGANSLIRHRSPPLKPGSPARLVAVIDGVDA